MKKVFNLTISVFLILAGACYAQEISYGGNWTMTCKGKASNYFGVVSHVDFSHKILIHDWEATSNLDLSLSQTDPGGYQLGISLAPLLVPTSDMNTWTCIMSKGM